MLDPIDPINPYLAARLVETAPEAWAERLCVVFEGDALSNGTHWMPFIRALPTKLQREVAKTWASAALELPWVQDNHSMQGCVRPADRARELLFDLGLDEPDQPIRED